MLTRFTTAATLLLGLACCASTCAAQGLSEIVNASGETVRFSIQREGTLPRPYTLAPRKKTQLAARSGTRLVIAARPRPVSLRVDAGRRYALVIGATGKFELRVTGRMGTPKKTQKPPRRDPVGKGTDLNASGKKITRARQGKDRPTAGSSLSIPVKILVDEEERTTKRLWQKRLADRLSKCSDVLAKTCGVRFVVESFDTWETDDRLTKFTRSLRELEQEVGLGRARLVIGFTSQYHITRGRTNVGGTRAALHSHILVREWSQQFSESERMEILLHELGHYLGATHSASSASVMRPMVADRQSRARAFDIRFDDANSQIMRLVAGELRKRRIHGLVDLTPRTKQALRAVYTRLGKAIPKDPAAKQFLYLLDHKAPALR